MSKLSHPELIDELAKQVILAWDLRQTDTEQAESKSHELLKEALSLGCHESVVLSYRTLAAVARMRREYEKALEYLQTALAYTKAHAEAKLCGVVYSELGRLYHEAGDLERSLHNLYEAHSCHLEHDDQEGLARSYTNLSNLLTKLGRFGEAESNYEQARVINRRLSNRRGEAAALGSLALMHFRQGNTQKSLELLLPLRDFFTEHDHPYDLCTYYINLGEIYHKAEDTRQAMAALREAARIAEAHDFRLLLIHARLGLGSAYLAMGEVANAEAEYLYVLSAEYSPSLAEILASALEGMSELCEKVERFPEALQYARRHFTAVSEMQRGRAEAAAAAVELRLSLQQREREKTLLQSANENLRNLNTDLQSVNAKLTDLNEQQRDMLRIVSHDIRNPLSAIVGMGNMLATEPEECMLDLSAMGSLIEESGRRLLGLVNNLLDVARLKSGEITLKRSPADVACIINESVQIFESLAHQKQVKLECRCGHLPFLLIDAPKLEQILSNLISNAIKFTETGGSVLVSADYGEGRLKMSVADNGIGFEEPALRSGLEGPLQRRGTHGERGTGLGLSIVNRFVELHGGTINITSAVGKGTTVHFEIPAKRGKLELSPEITTATEDSAA